MARVFNLLMLESELPSPDIYDEYGSYGDIVLNALRYTANPPIPQTSTLDVTKLSVLGAVEGKTLPKVKQFDAIFILGSSESSLVLQVRFQG